MIFTRKEPCPAARSRFGQIWPGVVAAFLASCGRTAAALPKVMGSPGSYLDDLMAGRLLDRSTAAAAAD
jgi:hypothetical protein